MQIARTSIPDILLIKPKVHEDDRGFFMETFHTEKFGELGLWNEFVQDNHSRSRQGVLRGLHYQVGRPQGKLVRVVSGEIFDVAVDIRRESKTFGNWVGELLSAENKLQMWVPPGFAHGYYVRSVSADILYKTSDYYFHELEHTIIWNDADISIEWPLVSGSPPILSNKDASGKRLAEAELF